MKSKLPVTITNTFVRLKIPTIKQKELFNQQYTQCDIIKINLWRKICQFGLPF